MKTVRCLREIDPHLNLGLTIGNFDGLHVGHCKLLDHVKKKCKEKSLVFTVMTFIPHPILVLNKKEQFLINSYSERRELLKIRGLELLIEVPFDQKFRTLSAKFFLHEYILSIKSLSSLFLGYDFSFGANREGDFKFAKKYCKNRGIDVFELNSFKINREIVSSTSIREKLEAGEINTVNHHLGRFFSLSGIVQKGVGRGREIGFPTANISVIPVRILPRKGVYRSRVVVGGKEFSSLTNIGVNPTFGLDKKIHIETHILNFDKEIYGEILKVFFIEKLRDEKKFCSVKDLVAQIKRDIQS